MELLLAVNVATGLAALALGAALLAWRARAGRPLSPALFATLTAASWLVHHLLGFAPDTV